MQIPVKHFKVLNAPPDPGEPNAVYFVMDEENETVETWVTNAEGQPFIAIGQQGLQGEQGPQGDQGNTGATGATGPAGDPATVVGLTDGATPALDASLGNTFILVAAGNRTIAVPTGAASGKRILIGHKASGADRTLDLNTGAGGFRFGTDITGLTATTSGKTDYIGCIYNATDNKWDVIAVVKGY